MSEKRVIPQLMPSRRRLAEEVRAHHVVTVESAEHRDDFLQPEFWGLVSQNFRIGDRVDIQDDELTFYGEYIVRACDKTWAQLELLHMVNFSPAQEEAVVPEYLVAHKGPHRKYCVIRRSDSSVIREGEQTRAAANAWLLDYARLTGAKVAA